MRWPAPLLFMMVVVICGLVVPLKAQTDTVKLDAVEITAIKDQLSAVGKRTEKIDSAIQAQFKTQSVADLLTMNSSLFIKSYGPGSIATTAFRGGNANQTAILWNGFNIQNAMLSQTDLSLLPAVFFDQVEIEYGGSSSLWGTGAVGGSIHLNNKTKFDQGLITSTTAGAGSFGRRNISTVISLSKKKFVSTSRAYRLSAVNDYTYYDNSGYDLFMRKKFPAAPFTQKGLLQEFRFLINSKQSLGVNFWYNTSERSLPDYYSSANRRASQEDENFRATANWNYSGDKLKSGIKAAFLNDKINFTDSFSSTFAKNRVSTIILENENYYKVNRHHQISLGLNATGNYARAVNYEGTKSLQRVSFLLGNRFSSSDKRLTVYVGTRLEYFSVGTLPFTWNLSSDYKLSKALSLAVNIGKVYRQPGLNELFWTPGGNPNLKAERGNTYEGSLSYKKQIRTIFLELGGSVYSRKINNWILWVPGAAGIPTPRNIQSVWNRGTETLWKVRYQRNQLVLALGLTTGYVLATTIADDQENGNIIGKQLIYTPRYNANGNVTLQYKKVSLVYFQQYIGYRFASTDNSQWIAPYYLANVRLNIGFKLRQLEANCFAAVNNLLDKHYMAISGRPMPSQNYEAGITIQTKYKTK